MKKSINGFIIVEGKEDKAFLSSFLDCEIVILEGYCVPHRTINYIKALSSFITPILLTDPDEAGETIRKRVNDLVDNIVNVSIDFQQRGKRIKKGVAETTKASVLSLLEPYFGVYNCDTNITLADLIELESKYKINIVKYLNKEFNTSATNKKGSLKQLKLLNINLANVEEKIRNGN